MPTNEKEYKSAVEELEARSAEIRKKIAELKKENSAAEKKQREQAEQAVGKWIIEALAGDWKKFDYEALRDQMPYIAEAVLVDAEDEGRDVAAARVAAAKKMKPKKPVAKQQEQPIAPPVMADEKSPF